MWEMMSHSVDPLYLDLPNAFYPTSHHIETKKRAKVEQNNYDQLGI